jgi:diguanylate cyclase (GGDEF)-like protein/PAS domain S-box-containing protein
MTVNGGRPDELIRSIPDAVVAIDSRGAIDFFNPAAEELFGYTAEFAAGRAFPGLIAETNVDEYEAYMKSHTAGEEVPILGETVEAIGRRADGTTFPMELVLTRLDSADHGMLVAIARDIRQRKSEEAQLRRLAEHDDSTGLINRRAFEHELTRHIDHAARYGGSGAVIEIDIDNFKFVNETLGPQGGDQLIKEVADVVRSRLRKTDVLARLGGDELGILVHNAGQAKASAVATDLLLLIRDHPFAISRQPVRVTASAGVAAIEERPITGSVLLAEAESAMYEAKENGKDRVVEYTAEEREELGSKRMWTERVRQATERGLFVLVCQPIQNLDTDEVTQYELLLRMRGENGQLVPPGAFLATAEQFGLIGAVDRWVTQQAVRLIAAQNAKGNRLILEVNLSGMTMTDDNFPTQLEKDLRRESIDPSQLVFEVTETAAVADIERAKVMAAKLTAIGCRFALDDFGSGFAGFYYLKHLPISYLKIDGEFVKELPDTLTDQLVVKALVDVCTGLGIKTIAEFVEDERTLEMLRDLGVDFAQGYHVGKPAPVSTLGEAQSAPAPA